MKRYGVEKTRRLKVCKELNTGFLQPQLKCEDAQHKDAVKSGGSHLGSGASNAQPPKHLGEAYECFIQRRQYEIEIANLLMNIWFRWVKP